MCFSSYVQRVICRLCVVMVSAVNSQLRDPGFKCRQELLSFLIDKWVYLPLSGVANNL